MAERDGCDNSRAGQTGTEMRSWWFQPLERVCWVKQGLQWWGAGTGPS